MPAFLLGQVSIAGISSSKILRFWPEPSQNGSSENAESGSHMASLVPVEEADRGPAGSGPSSRGFSSAFCGITFKTITSKFTH